MKNTILTTALIIAVVAGVGTAAAGPFGGPHKEYGPGLGGPGDLGMLHRITRMATRLDLSDEQVQQIDQLLEASKPEMERLTGLLHDGRESFRESHTPGEFDAAAARAFADAQAAIHADLMFLGMQTRSAVFSVLTPEQQEELRSMAEERGDRRGSPGKHGKRR